jgi:hypothetical protein
MERARGDAKERLNQIYPGPFLEACLVTDDQFPEKRYDSSVRFRDVQAKKHAKVKLNFENTALDANSESRVMVQLERA